MFNSQFDKIFQDTHGKPPGASCFALFTAGFFRTDKSFKE